MNGIALKDNLGPVLLWHGEFGSGDDWVLTSTKTQGAIPSRLFDSGFDVWIAWKRGTYPAKGHNTPSTHNATYNSANGTPAKNFWNFTSEEVATQDLPEIIKFIHKTRSSNSYVCDKLQIVTHSAGA